MSKPDDIRTATQQLIKAHGAQLPAPAANLATFTNWMFFGQANSIAIQVTVTPVSGLTAITFGSIALQTASGGVILCNGAFDTPNPSPGWTFNLFCSSDSFDTETYGTSVQAWAAVQAYVNGQLQTQFSPTMNYQVKP